MDDESRADWTVITDTCGARTLYGNPFASSPLLGLSNVYTAGDGIEIVNGVITNSAPDLVVTMTNGTGISVTGTYPDFTVTNTSPDLTVSIANGTGISVTGTYPNFTVTNTAPDQTVGLTAGSGISITGTYPNFTIAATGGGVGTVTDFSAGNLSPLFTTAVANSTTTPALSFSLTNAGANTYFGNATGGAGAPSYTAAGALTKTDDTNVTLTLGGNHATSLLRAASLTLGWTGTLAVARGGIGVGTITGLMQGNGTGAVTGITNSSTVGQTLRVTGASTYAWGALDLANSSAVTGDLPLSNIAQGTARSVLGVTGNATADYAPIQGTTDQVLRVNAAGTALAFGTVATGGIADDAVTYQKMQNVVANNVLLGNIGGAGGIVTELTVANVYTLLGLSGVAGRNAFWSGTNTLSNSANNLWDNTNGRLTIIPQVAGLGAGLAGINVNPIGMGSMEAFRAWGNIAGNIIGGIYNTNTTSTSHSIWQISSGSNAAGDPILQLNVAGSGGGTSIITIDNSDANKLKIIPNQVAAGVVANVGITLTNDAATLCGVNLDTPKHAWDVTGRVRASTGFIGKGVQWNSGMIDFGAGAGTGGSLALNSITGTDNWLYISFTTGNLPTADSVIFTATYPNAWPGAFNVSFVTFSADGTGNSATEITKFRTGGRTSAKFDFVSKGTLPANTNFQFCFQIGSLDS